MNGSASVTESPPSLLDIVLKAAELNCLRKKYALNIESRYCEYDFDGFYCWNYALAGETISQPCLNQFIKTNQVNAVVNRTCTKNGVWLPAKMEPCGKLYVADESSAIIITSQDDFYSDWLKWIKYISYTGYAVSIFATIIALLILILIKRLHCARNKLHIHLFISFLMRAIMFALKEMLFYKGTALRSQTYVLNGRVEYNYTWLCKLFISIQNYFLISNYNFILMEGIYLHNLMFLNLFSYKNGVTLYYILGWGIPLVFTIAWIVLRIFTDDTHCWTEKGKNYTVFLIDVPIGLTVAINFLLFLIITRVLFIKIQSICVQQRKKKYRKLIKSTLILIPLFGIPYFVSLILSFYIHQSQTLEIIWLFFDQSFSAFQGLFATLVYCLLNSDVQTEIKRKYASIKNGRNSKDFKRNRTISHTQQFSLQNHDDYYSDPYYGNNGMEIMTNGKKNNNYCECHF